MKDEVLRDDAISTVSFDYSYFNDKLSKMTKEEYNEALSKGEDEQAHGCRRGPRNRSYCRPHVLTERTR